MKTGSLSKKIFIFVIWLLSCVAQARSSKVITYNELKMRDYDEMLAEVKRRIQSADKLSKQDEALAQNELRLALLLVLSRPDNDNMVSKLVPILRTPLRNLDYYESALTDIVEHAINTAKNKSTRPAIGATSLIVLENFMGELKPEVSENKELRKLYEKIKSSQIKVSEPIQKEMRMQAMMKTGFSPSETAAQILADLNKKNNKEEKKSEPKDETEQVEDEDFSQDD